MGLFNKGKGVSSEGAKGPGSATGMEGPAVTPTAAVDSMGSLAMAPTPPAAVGVSLPALGSGGVQTEGLPVAEPPKQAADPLAGVAVGGGGTSLEEGLADGLLDAFKKEEILLDRNVASLADEVEAAEGEELVKLAHFVANHLGIEALEVEPD